MSDKTVKTLSVWVVDDEPGMCRGVVRTLEGYEESFTDPLVSVRYRVESMESGEEFFERLAQSRPHILLLDGKLPGIDGLVVLERLRATGVDLVTIMITAYATLDKAVQTMKLGAYDFLAKPFTPDELRHAVRKAARTVVLSQKACELENERKKVRFNFLSILAHELKAPLNAIDGYVTMIKSRQAGEMLADYDQMIDRIGTRTGGMRKLIADLLDLTCIEAGSRDRDLRAVDLVKIAGALAEQHRETPEARKLSVSVHLAPSESIFMEADAGEIETLLNNLLSNGIKYNRDGGSVTLTLSRSGSTVRIVCADTGIGMTQEERSKLFREFSRIRNDKTRGIEGSGLGLSIINRIVCLYHGKVTVTSTPGEGTSFTVELEDAGNSSSQKGKSS